MIEKKESMDGGGSFEPHCSYCKHYWTGHGYMFCTFLQRRITARKKVCENYKYEKEMATKEQLKEIVKKASEELLKRGFNVKLDITFTSPSSIKLISDNFQTTPVLYKNLYIEATGRIKSEETKNSAGEKLVRFSTCLFFQAKVETFTEGLNAVSLFSLNLVWLDNDDRVKIV